MATVQTYNQPTNDKSAQAAEAQEMTKTSKNLIGNILSQKSVNLKRAIALFRLH